MKYFYLFFLFVHLIFIHSVSYSQEKMETTLTHEEAGQIILFFPAKDLDEVTLAAVLADLPEGTFAIGTKEEKTIALFSNGISPHLETAELKSSEEVGLSLKHIPVNLKSLIDAFKDFKVEQVEIWVSVAAETGGITKLFVSGKGEGGMKVLLKPIKK